jgi:hypothetical protein
LTAIIVGLRFIPPLIRFLVVLLRRCSSLVQFLRDFIRVGYLYGSMLVLVNPIAFIHEIVLPPERQVDRVGHDHLIRVDPLVLPEVGEFAPDDLVLLEDVLIAVLQLHVAAKDLLLFMLHYVDLLLKVVILALYRLQFSAEVLGLASLRDH